MQNVCVLFFFLSLDRQAQLQVHRQCRLLAAEQQTHQRHQRIVHKLEVMRVQPVLP